MNIVIEGADGSGKSTLVDYIRSTLQWSVISSKGPTKTRLELNERAREFLACEQTIFDRHCIVSEYVYGSIRGSIMTLPVYHDAFYARTDQVLVYCQAFGALSHLPKDHDTQEHLAMVEENHARIVRMYDQWGLRYAHLLYRKGDDKSRIMNLLQGMIK